jgi:hypothetical protein
VVEYEPKTEQRFKAIHEKWLAQKWEVKAFTNSYMN